MDQDNSRMRIAKDCRLMISHMISTGEIEKYREQYQTMNEIDLEIQNVYKEVGIDEHSSEFAWVFELSSVIERNLFASANAYEYPVSQSSWRAGQNEVHRRRRRSASPPKNIGSSLKTG